MSDFEEIIRYRNSSVINTVWYSPDRQELLIEFRDGSDTTYYDVPSSVAENFQRATSLGEFLNDYIKGCYDYLPA